MTDDKLGSVVGMTEDELRLMEQIVDIHDTIRALGLKSNVSEFTHAVHTLQLFVLNRMLHRRQPEFWSTWYHERWLRRRRAAARVALIRTRRRVRSHRLHADWAADRSSRIRRPGALAGVSIGLGVAALVARRSAIQHYSRSSP